MRYKEQIYKQLDFSEAVLRDMERNIQRGRVNATTWGELQAKLQKSLAEVKKFIELELD